VRRRAAELAPALGTAAPARTVLALLDDDEPLVAEAAAFALGERAHPGPRVVTALARAATAHSDPLVREAAVAALGAVGDPNTLAVVLAACDDKPAVRRRAVLALAAFDGPEVEARLQTALTDRDWQVRQAAEDLISYQAQTGGPDRLQPPSRDGGPQVGAE
jgi:HEAT repeat protein